MSTNNTPAFTQEQFDRLPLLVSRSEFQSWTGLSDRDLQTEVASGRIPVWRPEDKSARRRRYARYYKWVIAQLCGLKL